MFKIVRASVDNIVDIADLFNQYRQFYGMASDLKSANDFIAQRLSSNDSTILVAMTNNKANGFVQIFPSFSSVAMRPIWILNDLFVTRRSRKSGCATQLIEALEEMANKNKIFSIKLSTAVNNHSAKSLYNHLGFTQVSDFDYYSLLIKT